MMARHKGTMLTKGPGWRGRAAGGWGPDCRGGLAGWPGDGHCEPRSIGERAEGPTFIKSDSASSCVISTDLLLCIISISRYPSIMPCARVKIDRISGCKAYRFADCTSCCRPLTMARCSKHPSFHHDILTLPNSMTTIHLLYAYACIRIVYVREYVCTYVCCTCICMRVMRVCTYVGLYSIEIHSAK